MVAVRGIIQGNTVIVEDEDIKRYDGKDVIVTILDYPYKQQKKKIDLKNIWTGEKRCSNQMRKNI